MRPKVFVVQPIPAEPLAVLEEVADVEVFDNVRRQISLEETIEGAKRSDYLVALHGNYMPAEVITANPDLKGISILGGTTVKVDFDAALAAKCRSSPAFAPCSCRLSGAGLAWPRLT